MKRYYDECNRRIVHIDNSATKQFWDSRWNTDDFYKSITSMPNSWVTLTTKKYLENGDILEGGCGLAQHVFSLQKHGYQSVGVDFAENTILNIRKAVPDLKVEIADVRKLPFDNNSFDGYWSLGVIEHFWNGYDDIANEMARVIRPGGFLFLTFPHVSTLRKIKIRFKKYKKWKDTSCEPDNFYQFALDSDDVKENMEKIGFELVHQHGLDAVKGIKDDIRLFSFLQKIYDSNSFLSKVIKKLINEIASNYCGHSWFMDLRKI